MGETIPVLILVATALSSLAFFRPWLVFGFAEPPDDVFRLSGAALARELGGTIPWIYITPAIILLMLLIASAGLLIRPAKVKLALAILMPALAIPVAFWPAKAIAHVVSNSVGLQARLSNSGLQVGQGGGVSLTKWWWLYAMALAVVILLGIIQVTMLMLRPKASPVDPGK